MGSSEINTAIANLHNNKRIIPTEIYLPKTDLKKWAVIACDQYVMDRSYWERIAQNIGNAPSALRFIIPEAFLAEATHNKIDVICKNMTELLSKQYFKKLDRGGVFTKRKTSTGIRYGIVAAIDLEQFSSDPKHNSPITASEAVIPERLSIRFLLRKNAPIELSHTILFFEDKQDEVIQWLNSIPLEQLYSFELMETGGHIEGYYLPEKIVVRINSVIQSQIFVADGNHSLSAAKKHWETLKSQLTEEQCNNHPARYHLVELVNIYSDSIKLYPIHRLISEIDEDRFYQYFSQNLPCNRNGNLIFLDSAASFTVLQKIDSLLEQYAHQHGGSIEYVHDETEFIRQANKHTLGIKIEPFGKEEILLHLRSGKLLPKKSFSLGKAHDKHYYIEGRCLK